MSLIWALILQVLNYSPWTWLIWIALTFCAVRIGGRWGIPVAWLAVTLILGYLDVRWIQSEMNKPGWDGSPDMDIVFDVGVMIRVVVMNGALLPVVFAALWMRRRARRHRSPSRFIPSAPPPTPTPG